MTNSKNLRDSHLKFHESLFNLSDNCNNGNQTHWNIKHICTERGKTIAEYDW